MKGNIHTFVSGDCLNHQEFTLADAGIKEQQTRLADGLFDRLEADLSDLSEKRANERGGASLYQKKGNVYLAHPPSTEGFGAAEVSFMGE